MNFNDCHKSNMSLCKAGLSKVKVALSPQKSVHLGNGRPPAAAAAQAHDRHSSRMPERGAFDSAKNHNRQRHKRQSVTAKREKSQTPKFV